MTIQFQDGPPPANEFFDDNKDTSQEEYVIKVGLSVSSISAILSFWLLFFVFFFRFGFLLFFFLFNCYPCSC